MTPMKSRDVAIVLASIDAPTTIEASVRGFLRELGDRGELVVVDASRGETTGPIASISRRVRVLRAEPGSLAPELWRDGLNRTVAELVAFSTCQMVPRDGWLSAMTAGLDATGSAGVGGPIAPGDGLTPTARALYLLRYANYLPPVPASPRFDPPGDNAMYRRDRLAGLEDSWSGGFWETEVHRHLRDCGETLSVVPEAVVEFGGDVPLGAALAHRLAHARRYGAGRSRGDRLARRLARSAAAPAVPPLLLARIVRNLVSRGEPLGPWLPALPSLGALLSTWSLGEAAGAMLGPGRRVASAA